MQNYAKQRTENGETEKQADKNRRVARRREHKQMNTLITPGTVNETMPKTVDLNESE